MILLLLFDIWNDLLIFSKKRISFMLKIIIISIGRIHDFVTENESYAHRINNIYVT